MSDPVLRGEARGCPAAGDAGAMPGRTAGPGLPGRVRGLVGARALALAALCGALLALAQPPVSWTLTLFAALPPLLWLMQGATGPRAAFSRGWAAGVGFFGLGLFWIVEPFLVDPVRHGWMAPFALLGMAGGLALFWGAAFAAARALRPVGLGGAVALACLWALAEFARSHVLTGFPWALPAYAWIETPAMQAASVIGPTGLGALTLAAGLLPAAARSRAQFSGSVALVAAFVAAAWGFGVWRLGALPIERAEPVIVRLVQPNAPQHLKWRPDMQAEFYARHLAASRAPAVTAPDVTIWSETAVPFVLGYADDLQAEIAAAAGGPVILGINRLEATPERERWFNSLAVLGPGGKPTAVYDKHKLVPFGEFFPLGETIGRLGGPRLATLTTRGFSAGPGPRLIATSGLPPFLPLICYEAIFPHLMRASEGRAEWMVQVTNDAWFGELAGPHQHLAQARARAIEQGLPLARAANTGISAMIDPNGRVVAEIPLGTEGFIDVRLPAPLGETIYARYGDLPALVGIIAALGLTVSNFSGGLSFRSRR